MSTEQSKYVTKVSMQVIKTRIEQKYRDKWRATWANLRSCRQTRFWLKSPRADYALTLQRPILARLIQAITGFNNLSYHTFNKGDYNLETLLERERGVFTPGRGMHKADRF